LAEPLHRDNRSTSRPDEAGRFAGALGERLRRARVVRGFSLRELARRLEVSPSLVSQIETEKIQPSVRTLYAIVSELGVSFDDIFAEARPPAAAVADARAPAGEAVVLRHDERSAIDLQTGVHWERLTTRNEPEVEFLFARYPPGSESAPADALVRHNGREFGLVLTGRLCATIGFDDYVLGPGDSVFFESSIPHRLHNDGAEPVTAVWVVLGRSS
jgi:transcriptional regulator with XRE-family HTH domain